MADPNAPAWAQQPDPNAAPSWAQAPAGKPAGATGFFGNLGQTWDDLTNPNHPQHQANTLESTIMGAANSPLVKGPAAAFTGAVMNSPIMNGLPATPVTGNVPIPGVRDVMEGLGYNRRPGETDAQLHQRYNQAIVQARQNADTNLASARDAIQTQNIPGWAKTVERGAQMGLDLGANIAANPEYFLLPGVGIGGNAATRIATAGLGNAGIGAASDAAAQYMDMASGVKKNFDIQQNLTSGALSGVFGGALHGAYEVAPFVKGLFGNRGVDTTPQANPTGSTISPMTGDHVQLNQADAMQYRQLLQTGSVDDIKGFFQGRNGPQPSYSDVNDWVNHRDGITRTGPVSQEMQPNFDYETAYNQHAEQQWADQNRQAVEDHVTQQTANWKNAPPVEVVHGPGDIADPDIRSQALEHDTGDDLGFFGADGKVRMYSGRISSPDEANALLFHEGLGHFGLAQKFGDRLDQVINSLLSRNVSQFSQETAKFQKNNPTAYGGDRTRAGEEVLAMASQNGQIKSTWQDAIGGAVRQFGRKMGLNLGYSDGEVRQVLAMAHDAVINGTDARGNGFRGSTPDPNNPNRFMFTGQKAVNFDQHFTASDGQPRGEISDDQARFHSPIRSATLGGVLDHPELYENYPQLHNVPITEETDPTAAGRYDPENRSISINTSGMSKLGAMQQMMKNERLKTFLHETQHAIQDIEQYPDFVKLVGGSAPLAKISADEYYNHPSEVEAFTTEDRQHMTMLERQANPIRFMNKGQLGEEHPLPFTERDVIVNGRMRGELIHRSEDQTLNTPMSPERREMLLERLATEHGDVPNEVYDNVKQAWRDAAGGKSGVSNPNLAKEIYVHDTSIRTPSSPNGMVVRSFPDRHAAFEWINSQPNQQDLGIDRLGTDQKYMNRSQLAPKDVAETAYDRLDDDSNVAVRPWNVAMKAAQDTALSLDRLKYTKGAGNLDQLLFKYDNAAEHLNSSLMTYADKITSGQQLEPQEHLDAIDTIANFHYVLGRIENDSSQVARALNAMKAIQFSRNNLLNLRQALADSGSTLEGLSDPDTMNKFMAQYKILGKTQGGQQLARDLSNPGWEKYALNLYRNILLSGLGTHVKAPMDMATGIALDIEDRLGATAIGKIHDALQAFGLTKQGGTDSREAVGYLLGAMRAVFSGDAWNRAVRTFNDPHAQTVRMSSDKPAVLPGIAGQVTSFPTRLIAAQDGFFRAISQTAHAYGLGISKSLAEGGEGMSYVDHIDRGVSYAIKDPANIEKALQEAKAGAKTAENAQIIKEATAVRDAANKTLLLSENPITSFLERGKQISTGADPIDRAITAAIDLITPIIRVPANSLLTRVIARSPAGFLDPETRNMFRAGGSQADIALSRMGVGTLKLAMYWAAAGAAGNLIGNQLTGTKKWGAEASGWRPDSVKESGTYETGNQLAASINPFDNHNSTVTTVADIREAYDNGANQGQVGTALKLASGTLMKDTFNQLWMGDIAKTMGIFSDSPSDSGAFTRTAGQMTSSVAVPPAVYQFRSMTDPYERDTSGNGSVTDTIKNMTMNRIPGMSQDLPIRYSVYGQPMRTGANIIGTHNPITGGSRVPETTDPVELELHRLDQTLPKNVTLITPVQHSVPTYDADGNEVKDDYGKTVNQKLSPTAFENYQRVAGQAIVEYVRNEMKTPEWQAMSDKEKVVEVQGIQKDMKAAAREALFNK